MGFKDETLYAGRRYLREGHRPPSGFSTESHLLHPASNAVAKLSADTGEVFPSLNGCIKECMYRPESKGLIFRKDGGLITQGARQIAVTSLSDEKKGERVLNWLKELINVTNIDSPDWG